MSAETKIEWAEHTGGPYLGCSIVSPGCGHCYARDLAEKRLINIFRSAYKAAGFADWDTRPVWGDKATRVLSKGFWNDARRINAKHAKEGTRGRWFPSMIDWLDTMPAGIISQDGEKLDPNTVLTDFLNLIRECDHLDFLLLTKRPDNFFPLLQMVWRLSPYTKVGQWVANWVANGDPPANVWIGTSVEDQQRADERIPALLKIPARVRFLSVEPLLWPISFTGANPFWIWAHDGKPCCTEKTGYHQHKWVEESGNAGNGIHWVIVGGESGKGARPCNVEWIRSIVAQCKAAGVKCFVKQIGSVWANDHKAKHKKGGEISEWPTDIQIREFPNA